VRRLEAKRADCAPIAGRSTFNRLELSRPESTRYHKISHDGTVIETLLVDLFVEAHRQAPRQIVLDLDATDDPLHGHQEDWFFHGYYDTYCYLSLYVTCGRHLLAATLRRSNIDGAAGAEIELERIVERIRASWPSVGILVRADSGFAHESLMAWCEAHGVDFALGLARNERLAKEIEWHMARAGAESQRTGEPLQGLPTHDTQELEPPSPRHRQGRMDTRRGQSALHRHHDFRLSLSARVPRGPRPARSGRPLIEQTAHSRRPFHAPHRGSRSCVRSEPTSAQGISQMNGRPA